MSEYSRRLLFLSFLVWLSVVSALCILPVFCFSGFPVVMLGSFPTYNASSLNLNDAQA